MRVALLRHAQTEGNLLRQYVGSSDLPLCSLGYQYAESLLPYEDVQRVFTSGLQRTLQTARILYPYAEKVQCKAFDEMDFGDFELKGWRDVEHDAAYRAWVDSGCELACPNGESKASFTRRCVEAFLTTAHKEASGGVAELHCVVHGGTIMAILSELAHPVRPYFDWTSGFCGGYLLDYNEAYSGDRPLQLVEPIRPKEGSGKP